MALGIYYSKIPIYSIFYLLNGDCIPIIGNQVRQKMENEMEEAGLIALVTSFELEILGQIRWPGA